MSHPLAIDLFCGSFGWSAGFRCVGVDISHEPYHGPVPEHCELVLRDILTVHGSQFRDAALIVASPPCQQYSYMAMPWKRGKAMAAEIWRSESKRKELNALFNACFRIQREACEAAGRYIPMVIENVKGAQPWVGRARARYGSYYLWGDVRMIGGKIAGIGPVDWNTPLLRCPRRTGGKVNPDGTQHGQGSWFAVADSKNRGVKAPGQDWNRFKETGEVSPDWKFQGEKVPGFNFHQHEKTGKPGGSFQSAAVKNGGGSWFNIAHNTESGVGQNPVNGVKVASESGRRTDVGKGTRFTSRDCGIEGTKQAGLSGPAWFNEGAASVSSKSSARKAASAAIAKIPFPLAEFIGRVYYPQGQAAGQYQPQQQLAELAIGE